MQEIFNQIMTFNKLDCFLVVISGIQIITGFTQGYKKSIYHSLKYILAYGTTRMAYKIFMPKLLETDWYYRYEGGIKEALEDILPKKFYLIEMYPIDRYVLNLLMFISMLIFLRLIIIGWAPQVSIFDRFAGILVGVAKAIIISTIIVLLISPFVEMMEPIFGNNVIEESQIVDYMREFNPFLNGTKLEF
ncbi:MAG: CvpA family protein [Filifactoraceae bacterium]